MIIHLPEDLERFIQAQVQGGQFASVEEAVAEAIRRVRRWEEERPAHPPASEPIPAWQRVLENMKDVPDAEFDQVPADNSGQLDHYLYGTPRRTAP